MRLECVRGQRWVALALDNEGRVAATAASVAFYPYRGRRRKAVVEATGLTHTCVALPAELVDSAWAMTIRVSW